MVDVSLPPAVVAVLTGGGLNVQNFLSEISTGVGSRITEITRGGGGEGPSLVYILRELIRDLDKSLNCLRGGYSPRTILEFNWEA